MYVILSLIMDTLDDIHKIVIDTSKADAKIRELYAEQQKSEQRNRAFVAEFYKEEERLQKADEEYDFRIRPTRRPRDALDNRINELTDELESLNNNVIRQCRAKQQKLLHWYKSHYNIQLEKESAAAYREYINNWGWYGGERKRFMYITYTDGDHQVYKSELKLVLDTHDDTIENLVSMRLVLTTASNRYKELLNEQKSHVYQLVRHLLNVLFTQMIYSTTKWHVKQDANHYYQDPDGLFRTRASRNDFNLTYTMSDGGAHAAGNIMFGLVDEHLQHAFGEDEDDFVDTHLTGEIRRATEFCNDELRRLATEEVDEDAVQQPSPKRLKPGPETDFKSTTAPTVATNMLVRLRL